MGDVAKGIKSFKKGMASDPTEDNSNKNITETEETKNQDDNKKNNPNATNWLVRDINNSINCNYSCWTKRFSYNDKKIGLGLVL